MGTLKTNRNVPAPDDVYDMLIKAHEGKSKEESDAFNARLILVLMNHIGDERVIKEALQAAEV